MPVLDWIGKKAIVNHHREVPYRTINCELRESAAIGDSGSRAFHQVATLVRGANP
jgi:adenine-specific DNA-methyltransferase